MALEMHRVIAVGGKPMVVEKLRELLSAAETNADAERVKAVARAVSMNIEHKNKENLTR